MSYISNFCDRRCVMFVWNLSHLKDWAKLLLSSLPVSPSRELRAPGASSYHLMPKQLRATWPRPEQSHLLPEACSPNGTDNRQQRQRRTECPPPELSNILKRFYALYDDRICYYKKKVSKLHYSPNLRTTQTFYTTSPTQRGKYLPQMKEMMYRMF